jgi:hypothetical protein
LLHGDGRSKLAMYRGTWNHAVVAYARSCKDYGQPGVTSHWQNGSRHTSQAIWLLTGAREGSASSFPTGNWSIDVGNHSGRLTIPGGISCTDDLSPGAAQRLKERSRTGNQSLKLLNYILLLALEYCPAHCREEIEQSKENVGGRRLRGYPTWKHRHQAPQVLKMELQLRLFVFANESSR